MNELFNFHNWGIVASHNLLWLLLAFVLGCYIGYTTCKSDRQQG